MATNTVQQTDPWSIGNTAAPLPPKVKGLPILGISHKLNNDPLQQLLKLYKEYGSIFRIPILNEDITVLAGLEANRFLSKIGDDVLSSKDIFDGLAEELDTDFTLLSLEGEEHKHFRKQSRRGYSRSSMTPHIDTLLQIIDDYTATLKPGDEIPVVRTLQFLVTQQLGMIVTGRSPDETFTYLKRFLDYVLNVRILKIWPRFMLKMPPFLEAKRKLLAMGSDILEEHRKDVNPEHRNLTHDTMNFTYKDGTPIDEQTKIALTAGTFFAGIDTVAVSLSFLLYNVLRYPDIQAAITEEANAVFAGNDVPALQDFKKMEMLHGAAIENLRMYPVAPFTPRIAKQPFEFAGYRVEAGTHLYLAQTITHYLDEFFPDPYTFDPMRFAKHGKGTVNAFAPYSLGAHVCLGAGIAEAQMMLNMARLAHNLELELEHPNYELKIRPQPSPSPGTDFKVRVVKNKMA